MREKIHAGFDLIPTELIVTINNQLDEKAKSAFALTCRRFSNDTQKERLVFKLLECVIAGNQNRAERLLKMRPELAAEKITITDWSGRTFICSAFEYALWALDIRYMCTMMLDCLPKNEKGEKIKSTLLEQAQLIHDEGLCYKLNGITYIEKHFNFGPLKNALEKYISGYKSWNELERQQYWFLIGKAQSLLPAHIRQHYCDPDNSFANPDFTKLKFIRSLKLYLSNMIWDAQLVGLGDSFTMWRANKSGCMARKEPGAVGKSDYQAMLALEQVRIQIDLPLLYKRLNTSIKDFNDSKYDALISKNHSHALIIRNILQDMRYNPRSKLAAVHKALEELIKSNQSIEEALQSNESSLCKALSIRRYGPIRFHKETSSLIKIREKVEALKSPDESTSDVKTL